jgi:ribosomal protein L37AE/L43A
MSSQEKDANANIRCPECGSKNVEDCGYNLFECQDCGNSWLLEDPR